MTALKTELDSCQSKIRKLEQENEDLITRLKQIRWLEEEKDNTIGSLTQDIRELEDMSISISSQENLMAYRFELDRFFRLLSQDIVDSEQATKRALAENENKMTSYRQKKKSLENQLLQAKKGD